MGNEEHILHEPHENRVNSFQSDESGAMYIIAIFFFFSMLLIGGIAVDIMHFETARTRIQSTTDAAVLAAADLDQTLEPAAVVQDYFEKAGLDGCLEEVVVDEGIGYRKVSATTKCDIPTIFMRMFHNPLATGVDRAGIYKMSAWGVSTAEENISDIEISLVLDISGSMGWDNRLTNLKAAGTTFVDTMITNSENGHTTISVVPYNASVNMGDDLGAQYNLNGIHSYSHCIAFEYEDYDDTAFDHTTERTQLSHFDTWTPDDVDVSPITNIEGGAHPWCWHENEKKILVHSSTASEIDGAIQDLEAYGNTAIDVGMRWGVALLDPSAQTPVANLIADGVVDANSVGRPVAYTVSETLKVVILMTDGRNTSQYDLKDEYKYGLSNIFVDRTNVGSGYGQSEVLYSVQVDGLDTPSNDSDDVWYHLETDVTEEEEQCYRKRRRWVCNTVDVPVHDFDFPDFDGNVDEVERLTWQQVFATWPLSRVYEEVYEDAYDDGFLSYSEAHQAESADETIVASSQANKRLSRICNAAREQGITIFAIAFEAPDDGQEALKDCATSISHYYEAEGSEIGDAFERIASQINHLRLTQ